MTRTKLKRKDFFKMPSYLTANPGTPKWVDLCTKAVAGKYLKITYVYENGFSVDFSPHFTYKNYFEINILYDELKHCEVCKDWNCLTVLE